MTSSLYLDAYRKDIDDLCRGKVVNLSSCLHKLATHFEFDDLTYEQGYEGFKVYANSKLANILFTKGLADRFDRKHSSMRCYAVHPGCVRTEFTRGLPWWMQLGNMIVAPILASLQKTPAQGAYGILEVLLNPEIDKTERNGTYFFHGKKAPLTPIAANYQVVDQLWELSEKMTGITWNKAKDQ